MSVFTAYLNDNAQNPLNRFVVYMLYNQVCNKHGDKSNRWNLGLILSKRRAWYKTYLKRRTAIYSSPLSARLLIAARRVARRIDSYSTAVHTKNGSREQNHAPLGVICYPFGRT